MRSAKRLLAITLVVFVGASACSGIDEQPSTGVVPPAPPEIYGEDIPVEEASIVYTIDVSCSMDSGWSTFVDEYGNNAAGYRIDRAKSAVNGAINELVETDRFDVVATLAPPSCARFGELVQATPDNKAQALEWVGSLSGGRCTGIGPCVAWALQNPGYEEVMEYFLLTGGRPRCIDDAWAYWETHKAMLLKANRKGARIDVILITPDYDDGSRAFGEDVTRESGGTLTTLE